MTSSLASFPLPTAAHAAFSVSRRNLVAGLVISFVLHALLMLLHFQPVNVTPTPHEPGLEVVLVNTRSAAKPLDAQLRAQAAVEGGGDDEAGHATSPLAPAPLATTADAPAPPELVAANRQRSELEQQQQQLLTQLQSPTLVAPQTAPGAQAAPPQPADTAQTADLASPLLQQYAIISERVSAYNRQPRRHFFVPSTSEYRFAQYEEAWRARVETVGNRHYPTQARGRVYGSLRLTVYVRRDGSVERVELDESSGHRVLDDAARRIVQLAAPYAPFAPDVARDTDVIVITRTWHFVNESLRMDTQ